jgi:signal transduction histidine kinase
MQMNFKKWYIDTIRRNCASPPNAVKDLRYWRNNLFAGMIMALLPFSLIALVPGVYWSFFTRQYIIAQADFAALTSILVIAFVKGIPRYRRKLLFIITLYLLASIMLYTVGQDGSGQLYLLMACTFGVIIFPTQYSYWPAIANTAIAVIVAIGCYLEIWPWSINVENATGIWIANSSSLVFLSFLTAALIPKLFLGLQQTLDNEKSLAQSLNKEQEALTHAMQMLKVKNSELEQFTYAASHDLQEPLRMVTSFLGQLQKKYEPIIDDRGKEYFWFAIDGAKRMKQLIVDLLEYSKIGSQNVILETINLNEVINDIKILYRGEIDKKDAKIFYEPLPNIHSNRVAIKQVFQNLISNSLKYSQPETAVIINISAADKEKHWEFSVTDNGIGIAKENLTIVFVIFQRLHNREVYSGTGIGLAITKKNVEQLGGQIWLESEEGAGSSFYFTVPKY